MQGMNDLVFAKHELIHRDLRLCVVIDAQIVFSSRDKGIVPIYRLFQSGMSLKEAAVADRLIGSGAARYLIQMGARQVSTLIIGKHARDLFEAAQIKVDYQDLVDHILNRAKDDYCPIEKISLAEQEFSHFHQIVSEFLLRTGQIII